MSGNTKEWIRPEEFMKLQIKKQKMLASRFLQQNNTNQPINSQSVQSSSGTNPKRNNPFAKATDQLPKKTRPDLLVASQETIFELIHSTQSKAAPNIEANDQVAQKSVESQHPVYNDNDEDDATSDEEPPKPVKVLPVDWSIKSRIRILSKSLVVKNNLTSSEEASGLTGFVRCLDFKSTSTGVNNSDGAKFHQNLMYWQHPHLSWLNLVQRNSSANNQFKIGEHESKALIKDWMECFKNLFQLLRTLQCPYFYVLANQFTVLFRAAGVGGRCEMHALLTPTTRGFRQTLKDEDIEFTQPLKKSTLPTPNTSVDTENKNPENTDTEDEDEMAFLESLGVDSSDIKFTDDVKASRREIEEDNGDLSTTLIEGVDCQAFFNFLLNAKSLVPNVGRLAGIPPTLLAPVAFLGGTLRKQTVRPSKLRLEGEDFFSIELKGAVMPTTIHTLCSLLSEIKDNYSLTMVNYPNTVALTKTSKKLLEDLDPAKAEADKFLWRENLSDSGMPKSILESLCRIDSDAVTIMERIQFSRDDGGFMVY